MTLPVLAWIVFGGLLIVCLRSFYWTWTFTGLYRKQTPAATTGLPRTAVVLALRGSDPFLPKCLEALFQLDHPDHHIFIVVDSRQDPAWGVAEQILSEQEPDHVTLLTIEQGYTTCSRKLSGLLEAVRNLDDSFEAIAFLDGDVIVHPEWLRELVTPLRKESIGATCGIRWFMPDSNEWGTLVRYLWNAGAVQEMRFFRIMWGGSLAVRRSVFEEGRFAETWQKSLVEDTHTWELVRKLGKQIQYVPQATMVNRESITLPHCASFIRRQMLNTRLYHGSWNWILFDALASSLIVGLGFVLLGLGLLLGNRPVAEVAGWGLGMFSACMTAHLMWMEYHIRKVLRGRNEKLSRIPWKTIPAGMVTQFLFPCCSLATIFHRKVIWRGLIYRFRGPFEVELLNYHHYNAEILEGAPANTSL